MQQSSAVTLTEISGIPDDGIIKTPGEYVLKSDIHVTRAIGIRIDCNDVCLDLDGYSVLNNSPDGNNCFGIYAMGSKNIVIKNGAIGLSDFGVHAPYSHSIQIENIDFKGCTYIGANIGGSDCHVKYCLFKNITGARKQAYAIGINIADGMNAIIAHNTFIDFYRQPHAVSSMIGEGVGILLGHNTSECDVHDNVLHNTRKEDHTYAIWAAGENHIILRNMVKNYQNGLMIGRTRAADNVFLIEGHLSQSVAISGGGGMSERNVIINFEEVYCNATVGDVDILMPPIMTADDYVYPESK